MMFSRRLSPACVFWAGTLIFGAAQAQTTKSLTVAQVLPLSGPLANVGKEIAQVTEAVLAEHNRTPGVVRLSLKVADDTNNAEQSSQKAQELVKESAVFLSCFGTTSCLAQQKVTQAAQVPLIGPIAGADAFRQPGMRHTLAVRASAHQELRRLLNFVSTMGLTRVSVAVQDDGFGRAYAAELDKLLPAYPQLQWERVAFDPKNLDHPATARTLRAKHPQALLLLANASHSTALMTAWKEQESLPMVLNLAGQANALFASRMQGYTGTAAFVTVVPSPWESRTQLQRDYQKLAKAAQLPISYLGFESFINATLLTHAVRTGKPTNAAELHKSLTEPAEIDLNGYTVGYRDNRFGSNFTDTSLLLKDGSFKH